MHKIITTEVVTYELNTYGLDKDTVSRVLKDLFIMYGYKITIPLTYRVTIEGDNLDEEVIKEKLLLAENKFVTLAKLETNLKYLGY